MLLLGHVGITLGTVAVLSQAWARSPFLRMENSTGGYDSGVPEDGDSPPPASTAARIAVDYRLVILGSLLPDLIDKPIGMVILGGFFSSGRIFGHSLLFPLALTLVGAYLWRRYGRTGGLVLSLSTALHLVLDSMWAFPQTLYWPLWGWGFYRFDMSGWLSHLFRDLLTDPEVMLQEGLGAAVLAGLAIWLVVGRRVRSFIRTGAIGW